jgi:hypothetical protein
MIVTMADDEDLANRIRELTAVRDRLRCSDAR